MRLAKGRAHGAALGLWHGVHLMQFHDGLIVSLGISRPSKSANRISTLTLLITGERTRNKGFSGRFPEFVVPSMRPSRQLLASVARSVPL